MKKLFPYLSILAIGVFFFGLVWSDPFGSKTSGSTETDAIQPTVPYTNAVVKYVDSLNGLNDTTSLKTRGYKLRRGAASGPIGTTYWFQGNSGVFAAFEGPVTGYVGANFNATTGANTIDLWLILPNLNVAAGDTISFYERSPAASGFPDSIRVHYASNGDTNASTGSWVELGKFKTTTTGSWTERRFVAPTAGANGRFAINYRVVNGGPSGANSDYIGIDLIRVLGPAGATPNYMGTWPTPGVNTNYIQIPHQASMIGFGNNFTIEAWVKVGNTAAPSTVLNKGATSFDYQLGMNTGGFPFVRVGGVVGTSTVAVVQGVWTHLAATWNGTQVIFYINGVAGTPVALTSTLGSSANEMRIGRGGSDPTSGNIEELRLWSVVRTPGAIDSNKCRKYPSQFNNAAGLKALWHLDNNAVDSVSGYNGTVLGTVTFDTVSFPIPGVNCNLVGIQNVGTEIPKLYSLEQNYPNPFNPVTNIKFSIPTSGFVELKIYDLLGREVATLVSDPMVAGTYNVDFEAGKLSSGVYFYSLESGNFKQTKKMLLVK